VPGDGRICVNGAAAHQVRPGDLVIICSYAEYDERESRDFQPRLVLVDDGNRLRARESEIGPRQKSRQA
jgi:aspartate 1-decarboxylase